MDTSYDKGEKVEVYYLPSKPRRAEINGFFSLWGGTTIVGVLGVVFFLIGGGMIVATTLKARRDEHLIVSAK